MKSKNIIFLLFLFVLILNLLMLFGCNMNEGATSGNGEKVEAPVESPSDESKYNTIELSCGIPFTLSPIIGTVIFFAVNNRKM